MGTLKIRPTQPGDMPGLQQVLDETALFPSDMLPAMLAGFLRGTPSEIWLTALTGGAPTGLCYAAPEPLADGTWNMRALAVRPADQGRGIGRALVAALEEMLRARQQRLIIVDTSGQAEFAPARAFYASCGYGEEARIRDFWAAGDDKVTFRKVLR